MSPEVPGLVVLGLLSAVLVSMIGVGPTLAHLLFWGVGLGGPIGLVLRSPSKDRPGRGSAAMLPPTPEPGSLPPEEDLALRARSAPDPAHRIACLLALEERSPAAPLTRDTRAACLHDPSPLVRLVAARFSEHSCCRRDTLLRLLHGPDETIAFSATRQLALSEGAGIEPELLRVVKSFRGLRREVAIQTLGEVGTLQAIETLRSVGSANALASLRLIQARLPRGGRGQLSLSWADGSGALSEAEGEGALAVSDSRSHSMS